MTTAVHEAAPYLVLQSQLLLGSDLRLQPTCRQRHMQMVSEAKELAASATGDGTVDVSDDSGAPSADAEATWDVTPIYVASEKWGRGLDLRLGYSLMLAPPATTAGYLHLSGRTGRSGANGTAITLTTHQQVGPFSSATRICA